MDNKYDCLKLENQLCFPLYVASKEIIRKYKPYLDECNLTYTQYIAMMVMWEKKKLKVTELGNYLFLDTGTVSPLIRKLESKGYVKITRSEKDERMQVISITKKGDKLKEKASKIPAEVGKCVNLNKNDSEELYRVLYTLIDGLQDKK